MTKVPNRDLATIEPTKIAGYLLSATHPVGAVKARFFCRFGFSAGASEVLAGAVLEHVRDNEIADVEPSAHGIKYRVDGPLRSPDGRNPAVSTVWMVPRGGTIPRFITAFPC